MKQIIDMLRERSFGQATRIAPLSGGIVNSTYKVTVGIERLLLQKVSPGLGGITVADYMRLEDHLRKNDVRIPRIFDHWETSEGSWRIMEYVEHIALEEPSNLHSMLGARHLRKTHEALKACPFRPSSAIAGFHDSRAIFEKLERLANASYAVEITRLADTILKEQALLSIAPDEGQLIHGDPKWKNFLFGITEDNLPKVWLIDWDTLMTGDPIIDLADMARSFCKDGNSFNISRFRTLCLGYRMDNLGKALSATKLITLELAARFIIDWFEDSYFGWDPMRFGSRMDSNLASAGRYVSYFKNMPDGIE